MSECLKPGAAVDHGAFVQIPGNVQKKGMQHPKRERLIDGDQYDDCCRQPSPEVPFEERQQIARDQRDMRHRPEYQGGNQQPERITIPGTCQRVTAKRSHHQRDRHSADHHNNGIQDIAPELFLNPGAIVPVPGEGAAGLGQGEDPIDSIAPVGLGEKISLNFERSPDRPDKWPDRNHQPEDDHRGGKPRQQARRFLCSSCHVTGSCDGSRARS